MNLHPRVIRCQEDDRTDVQLRQRVRQEEEPYSAASGQYDFDGWTWCNGTLGKSPALNKFPALSKSPGLGKFPALGNFKSPGLSKSPAPSKSPALSKFLALSKSPALSNFSSLAIGPLNAIPGKPDWRLQYMAQPPGTGWEQDQGWGQSGPVEDESDLGETVEGARSHRLGHLTCSGCVPPCQVR